VPRALWYTVDTNVLSNRTTTNSDPNGAEWLQRYAALVRLSVITIAEMHRALVLLEVEAAATVDYRVRSRLQAKLQRKRDWCNEIVDRFGDRIEHVDVARKWAEISVHFPSLRDGDKAIAATALAKGYGVATRNLGDFRRAGVPLVNPSDPSTWDEDWENDPVLTLLRE